MTTFPILSVADVERASRFYEQAFGFERTYRWSPEGGELEYVALRRGESHLGLARGAAGSAGFELCIYVEHVGDAASTLRALGAVEVQPPTDMPWGERMAYFDDPDGHRLHVTMSL